MQEKIRREIEYINLISIANDVLRKSHISRIENLLAISIFHETVLFYCKDVSLIM